MNILECIAKQWQNECSNASEIDVITHAIDNNIEVIIVQSI